MPTPAAPAAGPIRRRSTFRALRRPEVRASRGPLTVSYVSAVDANAQFTTQIGYVVSRRCGSAVVRNRVRRRLRAAVREVAADGLAEGSYLIRPEPAVATLDYDTLVARVADALTEAPRRAASRARGESR